MTKLSKILYYYNKKMFSYHAESSYTVCFINDGSNFNCDSAHQDE